MVCKVARLGISWMVEVIKVLTNEGIVDQDEGIVDLRIENSLIHNDRIVDPKCGIVDSLRGK